MTATAKRPGGPTLKLKHKLDEAVALSFSADLGTPVALFEKIARNQDFAFLFESTEGDSRLARYSFLSFDPCLTVSFKDGVMSVSEPGEKAVGEPGEMGGEKPGEKAMGTSGATIASAARSDIGTRGEAKTQNDPLAYLEQLLSQFQILAAAAID